jgi:hypothetical protein
MIHKGMGRTYSNPYPHGFKYIEMDYYEKRKRKNLTIIVPPLTYS